MENSLFEDTQDQYPPHYPESQNFDPLLYHPDIKEMREKELAPLPYMEGMGQGEMASKAGMEWIGHCKMVLLEPSSDELEAQLEQLLAIKEKAKEEATYLQGNSIKGGFFPEDFNEPVVAIDTETTGLDTRVIYDYDGNLVPQVIMAGLCLSWVLDEGYYLPIAHTEGDGVLNWHPEAIRELLQWFSDNFLCVYHNAQYDREIISQAGAKQRGFPYFVDTQTLDYLLDVNEKRHGLKPAAKRHLGRDMIAIEALFADQGMVKKKKDLVITFDRIAAKMAYVYGCSDAINTLRLFEFYITHPDNPLTKQPVPASIDHKLVDTLRASYRTGLPMRMRFAYYAALESLNLVLKLEDRINEFCGRKVDVGSPKQLSAILFDEFQIPPLDNMERGKMGFYSTAEDVLYSLYDKYPNYPILELVVKHRKVKNSMTKFFFKIVTNSYSCPKLPWVHGGMSFSITNAPTGRLSSSSNKGNERVNISMTKAGNLSKKYLTGAGSCGFNTHGVTVQFVNMEEGRNIKRMPSKVKQWLIDEGCSADSSNIHDVDIYPSLVRNQFAMDLNK